MDARQQGEVLRQREEGVQGLEGILGHPGQPRAPNGIPPGTGDIQWDSEGRHGPSGLDHARREHPEQGLDEEALPGAAFSQQPEAFSGSKGEAQGPQQARPVRPLEEEVVGAQGHARRIAPKLQLSKEFRRAIQKGLTPSGAALTLCNPITSRDPERFRHGTEESWIFCAQTFRSA